MFYTALRAYEAGGLQALLPARPGPRRAHKLGVEVVEALHAARKEGPALDSRELVELVRERFGLLGAPAQHRARSGAAKKTIVNGARRWRISDASHQRCANGL